MAEIAINEPVAAAHGDGEMARLQRPPGIRPFPATGAPASTQPSPGSAAATWGASLCGYTPASADSGSAAAAISQAWGGLGGIVEPANAGAKADGAPRT